MARSPHHQLLTSWFPKVKNFTLPLKFLETVQVLLDAKAQVDTKDENCCTALHRALGQNMKWETDSWGWRFETDDDSSDFFQLHTVLIVLQHYVDVDFLTQVPTCQHTSKIPVAWWRGFGSITVRDTMRCRTSQQLRDSESPPGCLSKHCHGGWM